MKKVLIISVTKDTLIPECLEALNGQDYPNYELLINVRPVEKLHDELIFNKHLNIIANSNEAREKALKTDADYFWWVESDIVPPKNALSSLMKQMGKKKSTIDFPLSPGKIIPKGTDVPEKHIMGGWTVHGSGDCSAGKWVADNTFCNLFYPQAGLIEVDKIDFSCVLLTREVMSKVKFESGLNRVFHWYGTEGDKLDINPCHCLMFAIRAQDLGYRLFMDGSVICKHIKGGVCQELTM